jgi:hypothetical protein
MMIEDKLALQDEEYWGDPWRTRRAVQRPLMQKGQDGLVLGAPSSVPLNQRQSLPVALIRVCKLTTVSKVRSRPTLILTAMDMGSYELRAGLALPPGGPPVAAKKRGKPPGKDSFSDDDSAMVGEGHTVDLAARLGVPVTRGEHVVTAILLDQVSNRCRMKVVESAGYEDPVADAFVAEFRASKLKPQPIYPRPGGRLPSYRLLDASPVIPAEAGITLVLPRVQAFDPEETECVLRGSFRLPIQPQHVVQPEEGEEPPEDTARVPITLILTG